MEIDGEISQAECREKVETLWRTFLTYAAEGHRELAERCINRFDERLLAEAEKMPAEKGARYLAMIKEERDLVMDEYDLDSDRLKARLGVGQPQQFAQSRQHGLGDLVVTTAVRATVWESVWAFFRLFR